MARGPSPAPPALPQAVFTLVPRDPARGRVGVQSRVLHAFGYVDGQDWEKPERYIRYREPLESKLDAQVEYDMDEQDEEWLKLVNAERKAQQLDAVSCEAFEIIMDRLEKEMFQLTKRLPQPDGALPADDSTCAICDDAEGENMNAIVFCDGCNLAVHQDCYGVPYIPEGQWLCRKCTVSPEHAVECLLCPNEGGAFKQTVQGEWVHLLCALWVRETQVVNSTFMEPVAGVDAIPRTRWKLRCSLCKHAGGAPIQCAKSQCFTAFHVTCARHAKLLLPMKAADGASGGVLEAFCTRHLPAAQRPAHAAAAAASTAAARTTKAARAYAKAYAAGPPLVPALVVARIVAYVNAVSLRKREMLVQAVCRYWSLKREARRGAPLLKRLHLEPWTASARESTQEDRVLTLEMLRKVRENLLAARELADSVVQRQALKLQRAQAVADALSRTLFPHAAVLKMTFAKIAGADKTHAFRAGWRGVSERLERCAYWDRGAFAADLLEPLDAALAEHAPDSPPHRAAARLRATALTALAELDAYATPHPHTGVGDLEPPQAVLTLLGEAPALADALDIVLHGPPGVELLAHAHAELKPKPPPPPRPPRKKRDYEAERARAAENRRKAGGGGAVEEPAAVVEPELEAEPEVLTGRRTRRAVAGAPAPADEPAPPPRKARGRPRRIAPVPTVEAVVEAPGPSGVVPFLGDVDNRQSFKSFETGWILPPDAKRTRGRPSAAAAPGPAPRREADAPPPRKRARLEAAEEPPEMEGAGGSSRTSSPLSSVESDAGGAMDVDDALSEAEAADAVASNDVQEPAIEEPPESAAPSEQEDSSGSSEPLKQAEPADQVEPAEAMEPPEPMVDSTEEAIAEEPAEAAEEPVKAADEPVAAAEELVGATEEPVAAVEEPIAVVEEPVTAKNRPRKVVIDVIETPAIRREKGQQRRKAARKPSETSGESTPVPPTFKSGQRVWAKSGSFPFWAAVVVEEHEAGIPKTVLSDKIKRKAPAGVTLVHFFDQHSSWGWIGPKHIQPLGESEDTDKQMLTQKVTAKYRAQISQSYKDALAALAPPLERDQETAEPGGDSVESGAADEEAVKAKEEENEDGE